MKYLVLFRSRNTPKFISEMERQSLPFGKYRAIYCMCILLFFVFILFSGCGVIMDPLRVEGTWTLNQVQFFATNTTLDATKTYTGVNADSPTSSSPINSEFFGDNIRTFYSIQDSAQDVVSSFKYSLTFNDDNTFELDINYTQTKSDGSASSVPSAPSPTASVYGSWAINQFDNSLLMKIGRNEDQKFGVNNYFYWRTNFYWNDGIYIKNYWPMTDYGTLVITMQAKDFGKSYFQPSLSGSSIKAATMTATFKK